MPTAVSDRHWYSPGAVAALVRCSSLLAMDDRNALGAARQPLMLCKKVHRKIIELVCS